MFYLGPLFFILVVDDRSEKLVDKSVGYDDDLRVPASNQSDAEEELFTIENCCQRNEMHSNVKKTVYRISEGSLN